jgi:hypothetical protein
VVANIGISCFEELQQWIIREILREFNRSIGKPYLQNPGTVFFTWCPIILVENGELTVAVNCDYHNACTPKDEGECCRYY